ncbi:hypothetical protein [Legionella longbeachae]|uniref:Secreted protein n=1 Tax=Legionella longbeachae serogroup 1 (strain NSW150) TaxID=661367 RepID=D3HPG3_LEGLN|nr:hypothetical protein [Legionella longbeachae]VEE01303.1 Uncharacterised protein [Legionella oakridgensis]HBD7398261.1 hypothetical protein [Legionella pneumophila]ARB92332.1 hypothetical protein A6J40_09170 [Legionella longbeachae]ARM34487.1 hypothetical protein B0B39_13550 [Legionella longbeachae]QEY50431.1 hypothetical protein FQU71_03730 [Legionella longbeachae]
MRHSIMTIILLVLAASTYANVASDILSSRTSDQQVQILGNIVNSAGLPCTPTQSFFQGLDSFGAAYWDIACADGRSFVIQIMNNAAATTTIIQCSAMQSLGVTCFKRFGQ